MKKLLKPVCELPKMKKHCKSCPFKYNDKGVFQDVDLANRVTERTLFKAQQTCHNTNDTTRCKGSWDHNFEIYKRLGFGDLVE